MTTKISEFADNLVGFITLHAESKYFISVLRYVSSNDIAHMSYFRRPGHILCLTEWPTDRQLTDPPAHPFIHPQTTWLTDWLSN